MCGAASKKCYIFSIRENGMLKRMRAQFPRTHDNETNRARLHHICVSEFLMGSRAHMGQTAKGLEEEVSIRYIRYERCSFGFWILEWPFLMLSVRRLLLLCVAFKVPIFVPNEVRTRDAKTAARM